MSNCTRLAWKLTLLSLQPWGVGLLVCLAVPCELTVMLRFVWAITLDTLGILDSAQEGGMAPPLTILALDNT